jgi:MOSC domain-containing protein YiiM
MSGAAVTAVASDGAHNLIKPTREQITLIAGLGVKGDAHFGKTVQHLYDKRRDPKAPNLRQVHLIHSELHDELAAQGFDVSAGQMGENITTRDLDLLHLPRGTQLYIGAQAVVEVTGLRNPCRKLNQIKDGLLPACIGAWDDGGVLPKTGIMGIVIKGGDVRPGDPIRAETPSCAHQRLKPV